MAMASSIYCELKVLFDEDDDELIALPIVVARDDVVRAAVAATALDEFDVIDERL